MGIEQFANYPAILEATQRWPAAIADLVESCITIQQIPAPTGHEAARATWVAGRMAELGLQDTVYDPATHNVYGRLPGIQSQPGLLITAHTDTMIQARDAFMGRELATIRWVLRRCWS